MKNFNDYFSNLYDDGTEYTVNGIKGTMYGNDECFDMDDFYQILVVGDRVYKCFYSIPDGTDDLSTIDYENADRMVDVTEEYEDLLD